MFETDCRQTNLFAKETQTLEAFLFLKYSSYLYKILISMLAPEKLFSRPGIFNEMSRIPEFQSRISFVSVRTQHNFEEKATLMSVDLTSSIHSGFHLFLT